MDGHAEFPENTRKIGLWPKELLTGKFSTARWRVDRVSILHLFSPYFGFSYLEFPSSGANGFPNVVRFMMASLGVSRELIDTFSSRTKILPLPLTKFFLAHNISAVSMVIADSVLLRVRTALACYFHLVFD